MIFLGISLLLFRDNLFQHLCHTDSHFPLHLKIPKPRYRPAFGAVDCIDMLVALPIPLDLGDPEFVKVIRGIWEERLGISGQE